MQNRLINYEGVVISVSKYKERGALIHLLTNKGVLTIFGLSYKSPKSKYHVLNNVFIKVNILGYTNKKNILKVKDLEILSYDYVNNFNFVEMENLAKIIKFLKLNDKNDEYIYKVFLEILKHIKKSTQKDIYLYYFICQLLKNNNINMKFNSCIYCSSEKGFKTFDITSGGLICKNCYNGEAVLTIEYIKVLKVLFLTNLENMYKLDFLEISALIKGDIKSLLIESLGFYI